MLPMQTAPFPGEHRLPTLTARANDFITARLARREPPERIAAALQANFEIEIDGDQVLACWNAHNTPPTRTGPGQKKESMQIPAEEGTQTEHRQDKESLQIPADAVSEPLFTHMTPDANPDAAQAGFSIVPDLGQVSVGAREEEALTTQTTLATPSTPATQTGPGQNPESLQIPADMVDARDIMRAAGRGDALEALGALVKARLGIAPDPAAATQTERRQDRKAPSILTDEVKAFIVRGLARYETPTRVAASVQAEFGIEINRRQVFAYDPAGSRPPAQRWIDLHAATRAKFMGATAEIGIAQKVVRLRMLDRYASRADENNQMERAAALLAQAAKECGGFYERYQRPKAAAAPSR